MSMQAEPYRNPFRMNEALRPIVVLYQDAEPSPPHNLAWMAAVDCMGADDDASLHEASASGFQVKGTEGGESCPLQFETRDELVSALNAAGYGDVEAFHVVLARIHGEEFSEYLGKISEVVPMPSAPTF